MNHGWQPQSSEKYCLMIKMSYLSKLKETKAERLTPIRSYGKSKSLALSEATDSSADVGFWEEIDQWYRDFRGEASN